MGLLHSINFLLKHPFNAKRPIRAIRDYCFWQAKSVLLKGPFIYQLTSKAKILVSRGMRGATGNIYCGLHEFEDMAFTMHFLLPGELFIDIGANVGVYTMLAAVEAKSRVMAFEPSSQSFNALKKNIELNGLENLVIGYKTALGNQMGETTMTHSIDAMNHIETLPNGQGEMVEINTLDNLLSENCPALIKIDVEGFESAVLEGAKKTLSNPLLKAIIIELNGLGNRYGFDENAIHNSLLSYGFFAYTYNPDSRQLIAIEKHGHHNTIYIRNISEAQQREQQAKAIQVKERLI